MKEGGRRGEPGRRTRRRRFGHRGGCAAEERRVPPPPLTGECAVEKTFFHPKILSIYESTKNTCSCDLNPYVKGVFY